MLGMLQGAPQQGGAMGGYNQAVLCKHLPSHYCLNRALRGSQRCAILPQHMVSPGAALLNI